MAKQRAVMAESATPPSKAEMENEQHRWQAESMASDAIKEHPKFKMAVKKLMNHLKKGKKLALAVVLGRRAQPHRLVDEGSTDDSMGM